MKRAIVGSILSVCLGAQAFAGTPPATSAGAGAPAEQGEPQTLTAAMSSSTAPRLTGWFLAPTMGATEFGGHLSYSPGLRGGIYLNRQLAIGLTAQGLGTEESKYGDNGVRNVGTYGGLLLQYVLGSDRLVHTSFESTIGAGKFCAVINDDNDGCRGRTFLMVEPVANMEINVSKHVRLATGVGYRFAAAGSGQGPSSRDMSSIVARTSVIFGSF